MLSKRIVFDEIFNDHSLYPSSQGLKSKKRKMCYTKEHRNYHCSNCGSSDHTIVRCEWEFERLIAKNIICENMLLLSFKNSQAYIRILRKNHGDTRCSDCGEISHNEAIFHYKSKESCDVVCFALVRSTIFTGRMFVRWILWKTGLSFEIVEIIISNFGIDRCFLNNFHDYPTKINWNYKTFDDDEDRGPMYWYTGSFNDDENNNNSLIDC